MAREFLAYPETRTTADVINDLRENAERYRDYDVQYAYVVSPQGRLRGVLPLRDLLLQSETTPISETMRPDPLSVIDTESLENLDTFFDEHPFLAAPVVNEKQRLLGVVTREAVEEALGERADAIYLKTQGIVGGEGLRSMPVLLRSKRRLSWLSINIVLNIMAASVIAYYEDTLSAVIALAVFLPIISDMSGCSGNQAVAVSMREITLGLIKPIDILWVWIQELKVGAINGIALGLLVAMLAWLWKGNPYLGLVAGAALSINTMIAVSIGGLVPLVLRRFDMDPALASGPILTTITDLCGFLLVMGLATAMLGHLV